MRPYTALVSKLLFPLHERAKRHSTVAVRQALERSQWLSPAQLVELQAQRLRKLLQEAQQHVPYYRALFARLGFDPATVTGPADLQRLPTLTKPIVRANFDALRHAHARGLVKGSTGGSSGQPLHFLIGLERVSHDVAAKWRATRWWGVDIGDPEVVVWGSPIELGTQDRLRLWRDRAMRSTLLSAFDMTEANLDGFIRDIRRVRPKMLFGYPYSMSHIAQHAKKRGVRMDDLGIQVAFVTSEALYPHQRAIISSVFGCPVANGYGGRDAGFIAHECPAGGMHITAEDIVVEILDAEGNALPPGQAGEVTVTHLASRDYPFIRYRTGDIAVLDDKPCACGRGLALMREIQGRTNDFLTSTTGTPIPCGAFTYLVRETPGIESFKIVQESLQHTDVQLVVGQGFAPDSAKTLATNFRRRLGAEVNVVVRLVDEIKAEANGKFRYIASRVPAVGNTPLAGTAAGSDAAPAPREASLQGNDCA